MALFISVTAPLTRSERVHAAKAGSAIAYVAMLVFALTGRKLFELFGISVGSLYIGGGMIIFLMGLSMINYDDSKDAGALEGAQATASKKKKVDISVTPLAIPIICGPCCITSIIALQADADGFVQNAAGIAALTLVAALIYLLLRLSAYGTKWLTPSVLSVSCKLSGIILVSLAVEMIVSGLRYKDLRVLEPLKKDKPPVVELQEK